MREMMPPRYLPIIEKRSGLDRKTVFLAVKEENRRSKAWPHIVKLAKEWQKQQEEEAQLLAP